MPEMLKTSLDVSEWNGHIFTLPLYQSQPVLLLLVCWKKCICKCGLNLQAGLVVVLVVTVIINITFILDTSRRLQDTAPKSGTPLPSLFFIQCFFSFFSSSFLHFFLLLTLHVCVCAHFVLILSCLFQRLFSSTPSIFCFSLCLHPNITALVDWAWNTKLLTSLCLCVFVSVSPFVSFSLLAPPPPPPKSFEVSSTVSAPYDNRLILFCVVKLYAFHEVFTWSMSCLTLSYSR